MSENGITFDGNRVATATSRWEAPVRVVDAAQVGDLVILVLDWTSLPESRSGQIQNLRAYSLDGQEVWTAEHPTDGPADSYTDILSREPLVVGNFAGFRCRIEPSSGRLLESTFTK